MSLGWTYIRNREVSISGPKLQYDHFKIMDISTAKGRADALAGFEELAAQDGNPQLAALGCVEAGDLCLRQKVVGDPVPDALVVARKRYQRVVDEFSDQAIPLGRAYLGLAKLAETEGEFAAARENYELVVSLGENTTQFATAEATKALAALGELNKPVRLAKQRPLPPTTQPDTPPAVAP